VEPGESLPTMGLEGRVVGPWVEECRCAWEVIRAELGARKLRLDLRGLMYVDARGTKLLREIHRTSGAEVLADGPLTKYFAERITRENKRNANEGD
jgi:hypothetical protein